MGSLINNIPVNKPQTLPVQQNRSSSSAINSVGSQFPQIMTYNYLPAETLSPARTTPKGVRAQKPSGKLVKENILQSAGSTVKSYANISKHFLNAAFNGEVNAEGSDYYVGKINDLTIRAGSLGIATVLATSKLLPFAKGMEFIGLGTWFASMALWPHIMGAPIKWKTGVDINQKYIDSYGRRKYVYEDNQYRPMDLFRHVDVKGRTLSEKEYYKKYKKDYAYLDKLGDKQGIPRNIHNRNEAVMNKSGQIAVQGRTLSMLTAGVMTPVLSSVIADKLQVPFKNFLENHRVDKATKQIQQLDSELDYLLNNVAGFDKRQIKTDLDVIAKRTGVNIPEEQIKEFKALLGGNDSIVDESGIKKIKQYFADRYKGTGFYDAIEKSLSCDFAHEEPKLLFSDKLHDDLRKTTSEAVKNALSKMNKEFVENLPDTIKNYDGITLEEFNNIKRIAKVSTGEALDVLKTNTLENVLNRLSIQKIKELGIDEDAVAMISDAMNSGISKMLKSKQYHPLSKDNLLKLFKLAEINVQLQNKVEHFQKATIMNIAESVTANNWEVLPPKYLEAMNFTKQEIAQLATISSSEASKVLSAKLDSIVANPNEYKSVLEKMSKLAQSAITKEEKAVIQLIGTADEAGTLSKIKDLMEASANENLGKFVNKVKKSSLGESLRVYYQTAIFDIQKKMRNTIDSFVRPIKALDTFHDIEQKVVDILGKDEEAFIAKVKDPNSPYYMFEKMDYQQAKKSLTKYIKDIALDKNDINNWTTKFEHNIPGGKRGMKYNLNLVKSIADVVNGDVGKSTEQIIGESFAKKCNINNTVMRYRFLNLEYKLAKDYKNGGCYMKVKFPAEQLVKNICEGDFSQLHILEALIDERKSELSLDAIGKLKEIRDTARKGYQYKVDNWAKFRDEVVSLLDFQTSNKSISEMAGKNVTDFFVNAAQSARSRNKWAKFAYGLLIGTTALSAIFIANIGRKNNFNKDKYEYKNFAQGVNK